MKDKTTITITLTAVEAQEAVKAMSYYQSKLRQRNRYTQKRNDLKTRDGGGYDAMSYGSYCCGIMLYRNQRIETLQRCINKLEEIFPEMNESEEEDTKIVELKTFIIQCNGLNKANLQKALKLIDALRPDSYKNCNSRWKPSEEQEVDLEKIIEQTYHDGSVADTSDMDHVDYDNIARHFYELGVNARKEE